MQEAVEQAWRSRRQLRGGAAAFPSWIRRIVVNRSINRLKRRRWERPTDPVDLIALQEEAASVDPIDRELIEHLFHSLEEHQRQIVVLRFLGDLTLKEIAAHLEPPLGTVKSRLHRALAELRKLLAGSELERRVAP